LTHLQVESTKHVEEVNSWKTKYLELDSEFRARDAIHRNEINQLKLQADSFSSHTQEKVKYSVEITVLQEELTKWQQSDKASKQRLAELEAELAQARINLKLQHDFEHQVESTLQLCTRAVVALQHKVDRQHHLYKMQLTRLTDENNRYVTAVSSLKEENNTLQDDLDHLRGEVSKWRDQYLDLREKLRSNSAPTSPVPASSTNSTENIPPVSISIAEHQMTELRQLLHSKSEQCEQLTQQLSTLQQHSLNASGSSAAAREREEFEHRVLEAVDLAHEAVYMLARKVRLNAPAATQMSAGCVVPLLVARWQLRVRERKIAELEMRQEESRQLLELREKEYNMKVSELVQANSELEGELLHSEEELDQMDLKVATLSASVEKLTLEKSTWEDAMKEQYETFRQREILLEEASVYHSSMTTTTETHSATEGPQRSEFELEVLLFSNFVTQQLQTVLSKLLQQPHLVGTSITTLRQLSVATSQISIKTTRYQLNQTEVQQLPGNARVIVRQLEQFISELEARLEEGNQMSDLQKKQLLDERAELETENAVLEGDLTRFEEACKQQEDELIQVEAQRDHFEQLWKDTQAQAAKIEAEFMQSMESRDLVAEARQYSTTQNPNGDDDDDILFKP